MSGQLTVIVTSPVLGLPSLVVVALAEFTTSPQGAAVVGDVRCTCLDVPLAMSPKLQVKTPSAIEQPVSLLAASIVQTSPGFVGRVSWTTTPFAVPAPLFVTVIV